MKVVITGASRGIGKATVEKFLSHGHQVIGIDIEAPTINELNYQHIQRDVWEPLPPIGDVEILITCAGVQNSGRDIDINLKGTIKTIQAYGLSSSIKSIVTLASVSAHNGAEFPEYVASKGGVVSYTKAIAKKIAEWGATCNSISFGGVLTELNSPVMRDPVKWDQVMEETPLKKWATAEESADWIYFMAAVNKSMSGQDIIVDNLEMLNHNFIW